MAARKYFGTDGIRGRVGERPITADFMLHLGWAAGRVLGDADGGKVIIGKDTRISGYMFESVLEAGLTAAGVGVQLLGPMPTPAVAYLTRTLHARAGIVISASHNAFQDNGIKFFDRDGNKLPDEVERAIEGELDRPMHTVGSAELGKAERVTDAAGRYIEFCKSTVPYSLRLKGLKIVVDCAHGATYHVAPSVFDELGADVSTVGCEPDGLNINDGVGAVSPGALQEAVVEREADLGIAFDGDGDRVQMVDRHGVLVDGDELLYIIAASRHEEGRLAGPVVGTVMSNLGLEQALGARGVELRRARVGDRYVLEQLRACGGLLGGETSGHILCLDRVTTGDAIVSALQVLFAMNRASQGLDEIKRGMTKRPQVLLNVPVDGADAAAVVALPAVGEAVGEVEAALAGNGRVVLRPSGTEPLIRVMVEGPEAERVSALAERIAGAVRDALGR